MVSMNNKVIKLIRKFCKINHLDYKKTKKTFRNNPDKQKELKRIMTVKLIHNYGNKI